MTTILRARSTMRSIGDAGYETNLCSHPRRPRCSALFAGLGHVVLVAARLSEPAPTTVYGLSSRRLWATTVAVLALFSVVIGGLACQSFRHRLRATRSHRGLDGGANRRGQRRAGFGLRRRWSWQRQRSSRWRRGVGAGAGRYWP